MGVYSNTRLSYGSSYDVQPNESYEGVYGAQIAMIESCQNELAIFEATIRNDFAETYMMVEGASYEEIQSFNEGVLGDMFASIKNFLKKLWEKIKGIFHNFMVKIDRVFMKSNKEFVEKYKKEVTRKDLSDFEVKGKKPDMSKIKAANDGFNFDQIANDIDMATYDNKSVADLNKIIETNLDSDGKDDIICKILKTTKVNVTDPKDFEKDAIDEWFDDDTHDKINIYDIMAEMLNFKDLKKNLENDNRAIEKNIKELLKIIDKNETLAIKVLPKGTEAEEKHKAIQYKLNKTNNEWKHSAELYKDDEYINKVSGASAAKDYDFKTDSTGNTKDKTSTGAQQWQKIHQIIRTYVECAQTAATKYTALSIKVANMCNDWNRKVWAAAVAYKPKNEDATLTEAWQTYAEFTAE